MKNFDLWGFIPSFLHDDDPRPVKEQFNERYVSGWSPFGEWSFDLATQVLQYISKDEDGQDPPMSSLAAMTFRDETIILYPHAWILILQKDGAWEVARMD